MALRKSMVSSKSNEWTTPQFIFDMLNKEFNFTLDPCCQKETAKCAKYFTPEHDGLSQDWSRDTVFMNPPYGGHTGDWIKKAYEESLKGAVVVCLIVSATDRSYWHDYIFRHADQIRFIRGRIKFGDSNTSAPFASAIIVFGKSYFEQIKFYSFSISQLMAQQKIKESSEQQATRKGKNFEI